ncbi:MAG: aminotransferase class V-fold PLP-dependent enzyme [Alphaproteobacteria bacterium]|nr:aminotransferase class V-fold PLP-dependent enzyme [Alphaproteobacteria bacterium]
MNVKPRGRHFFNNPGPTNIPDRILRAMDRPTVDFLHPEFLEVHRACHAGVKRILKTDGELFIHASTGHGAWEAAVANLFSPGDLVLCIETGHFSNGWQEMGEMLGLKIEKLGADWRKGIEFDKITERLLKDKNHEIKGIFAVHNETATGMVLPLADVRRAIDAAKHPALLLSDTISSLGSMEYKMYAWGVDVTVGGSQKGLMMPTGLAITGVSKKAMEASRHSKMPKYYFNWALMASRMPQKFIGTVPVHQFYGLHESIKMIEEEGLNAIFARHARLGEATRECVRAWGKDGKGPSLFGQTVDRLSNSVTTIVMPEGHSADPMRKIALDRFNLSLGGGLGPLMGKVFRIGHLGDLNEPMLLGCLATTELAMKVAGVPFSPGVDAAVKSLAS